MIHSTVEGAPEFGSSITLGILTRCQFVDEKRVLGFTRSEEDCDEWGLDCAGWDEVCFFWVDGLGVDICE